MRLVRLALLPVLLLFAFQAAAQFPTKPITIVVPYQAGGSPLEALVRMMADEMSKSLKQPVVLEYKPGASTTIGAAYVARAPSDGHTLFVNAQSFLISAQLMSKLPYDARKDFVPVSMLTSFPHALIVGSEAPYKTAREFIEATKAKGSEMHYGSFGNASSGHLAFEGLKKTYGFQMIHVPYKGGEGVNDLIAGRLDAMLNDLPAVVQFAKTGKLRILALAHDKRDPTAPDVPTFAEATGVPFSSQSWFGILVRAETPTNVREVLHREIVAALKNPQVEQKMKALGIDARPTTPEEFGAFMDREQKRLAEAIAFSGARME
jgi:tripartite-type tricarboxylate transporter receptor subunit TctC